MRSNDTKQYLAWDLKSSFTLAAMKDFIYLSSNYGSQRHPCAVLYVTDY